jgi:uncharacterized protein (TIGR00251 family)
LSDSPLTLARDGVRIAVRVSPRANADRVLGVGAVAGGGRVVKVAVTAAPEAGRANDALLRLIARAWHLRRSDLSIVAGAASRNKIVRVAGDPRQVSDKLAAQIAGLPGS